MVSTDDGDEDRTIQRFDTLCYDLNMDITAKEEAWQSYERISMNYTLEGNRLHWLACSLYVSCRSGVTPMIRPGGQIEGNCVSLTRLLRSAKVSLLEFFKKMKKWTDMASLPQEFRDKIERLERNFAVSTVTFKKFEPIFRDIFKSPERIPPPTEEPPRAPKGRKQRRVPCTATEMFNFCWTMFILVKGHYPAISDDLVNSYHLLLCCLDWFYANTIVSNRRDLLNPNFSGLPKNYSLRDYKPPSEVPCIIQLLCDKHGGLHMEAKEIKEHWWKSYIRKLFDKRVLQGKAENLTGVIELGNFDVNSKAMNAKYEAYVLNVGDFDERIFLGDEASLEIGTPARGSLSTNAGVESTERLQVSKNLWQNYQDSSGVLAPLTPLTGRRYLGEKEGLVTPVSTATQSVSRLQILLSGCKTCPSDALVELFSKCARNPQAALLQRVGEMGETFCTRFAQLGDDQPPCVNDFARRRLQLGESLYYKVLEKILLSELQRINCGSSNVATSTTAAVAGTASSNKTVDLSNLLEQDVFHRSLFAICLEIVLFSYNSQRVFPWIIEVFDIYSYYFYKVIEVLIRVEDGLSRDVVKHLNHIEETILENLAWKSDSPLWDAIAQAGGKPPSVEEVSLPSQLERDGPGVSGSITGTAAVAVTTTTTAAATRLFTSPPIHPGIQRITTGVTGITVRRDIMTSVHSPHSPSAAERFSSPAPGSSAKRRLFDSGATGGLVQPTPVGAGRAGMLPGASSPVPIPMALITDKLGRQILIPVQMSQSSPDRRRPIEPAGETLTTAPVVARPAVPAISNKPKRTGSLALFFRKLYHLASVRMRDLCDRLEVDPEMCSQMWTCYEHCLMQHVELMKDRHIDQIIMCAVYVMAKVTGKDRSFQDIMRCYRLQPQAQSHIYRSVLLDSRQHAADTGDRATSSRPSPRARREKLTTGGNSKTVAGAAPAADSLSTIRSSSTLPMGEPSSAPPTPTRMAGAGNTFQFEDRGEDRGDLIKFYNMIFVVKIKNFALKFSSQNNNADKPPLSPLPIRRFNPTSPRKVSQNHSVYVSPHKPTGSSSAALVTPQTRLLYCFNRSPARDLRAINNMLRTRSSSSSSTSGSSNNGIKKRLPLSDDGAVDSPAKRSLTSASPGGLHRRLEEVMSERKATNGAG